jgi:branched-chain amino acid transport system substrate-binding protein
LHLKGAQLAAEDINASGGIKALGGAKIKLIAVDAGDSTEKAKNAAQRMLSQDPDLVGGTGAFLSSFTLAITEITERAEVPWLTLSYSDQITARGYKYVFQTSPVASKQSVEAVPTMMELAKISGSSIKTVAIVMDNTASPVAFTKPLREGGLDKLGIKLVVDEIYTPPMSDATSIVQKVRNARPDMLLLITTNIPDTKLILEKMNEMGIGRGRIPILGNGGHFGLPELLNVTGKEQLEGVMVAMANWSGKGHDKLVADFKSKFQEPWMPQDSISTYGDIWIFKEAMEKAGSADPKKVAAAIRGFNETGGASRFFPGGKLSFEPNGRRVNSELVIIQWQNGEPKTVYPPSFAATSAAWPKR